MYTIISAYDSDLFVNDIYELECICFPDDNWSEKLIKNDIFNEKSHYYVCFVNDSLVGYINASVILDEAELNRVAVHPEYRRLGIARALIKRLIDDLNRRNCNLLMLEVRRNNIEAISLYESLNFKKDGLRKNYYQNPLDDAVLMSLNL